MNENDYIGYVTDDERLYLDKEDVPEGSDYKEVTLSESEFNEAICTPMGYAWYYKDGEPVLLEYETPDSKRQSLLNKICDYEAYLSDTDYIISKLNELKLEDDESYETEKANYADVLAKRKEARSKINELREKLSSLE
jgi:hypothetical protein